MESKQSLRIQEVCDKYAFDIHEYVKSDNNSNRKWDFFTDIHDIVNAKRKGRKFSLENKKFTTVLGDVISFEPRLIISQWIYINGK